MFVSKNDHHYISPLLKINFIGSNISIPYSTLFPYHGTYGNATHIVIKDGSVALAWERGVLFQCQLLLDCIIIGHNNLKKDIHKTASSNVQ